MRTTFATRFLDAKGLFVPRVCLHFIVPLMASSALGFLPEATLGQLYHGTAIEPFSPFMAGSAALLGVFVARKLLDRAALWSWIPGLLVFCFGALELMRWWSPSWDYSPKRWRYAVRNLLTSNCGSTECLDELFYTMPFVCSIAYSVASYYVLRRTRHLQPAIFEGSARATRA